LTNRDLLTKRWRAAKALRGRLYWRASNPVLDWEPDEIARAVYRGVVVAHFYSLAEMVRLIDQAEHDASRSRD